MRGQASSKIASTSNRVIAVGFCLFLQNKTKILAMRNAKCKLRQFLRHNYTYVAIFIFKIKTS